MPVMDRFRRLLTSPTALHLALLVFLWLFFFWRLWTPTAADRVIFEKGDFPLHYFSYADYQVERMWDGDPFPLWNPYNYGGDPFAANVQWNVWYPPRWIAALLVGPGGWSIEAHQFETAAHYFLSSLLMYAFLRVLLREVTQAGGTSSRWLRGFPALIGSVLWTYGGYLTGYPMLQPSILYAIGWLPAMLLGAHLSVTDDRWRVRGILFSAVMMALSFFGGHTQTTMQMTYFTGAYILFLGWQRGTNWRGLVGRVALLGISGAALSAVQLLPAIELTRHAFRSEDFFYADKSVGFTISELVQVVWPRLFGALWWPLYAGVAGLLLGLGAMLRPTRHHSFWIGTIVITLGLALGGHAAIYDFFYVFVPGFSVFREQERAASLAVFALVALASYQIAWLFQTRSDTEQPGNEPLRARDLKPWTWIVRGHLALAWIVFLTVIVGLVLRGDQDALPGPVPDALGTVAIASLLFTLWLSWQGREPRLIVPAALVLLIVADLFTFGINAPNYVADTQENRIQPPDFMDSLSVPADEIAWHVDGGVGVQTYGTYWRIPDIYGTGPFSLASTVKLRGLRVDARWEVFAVRYATMFDSVPDNVALTALGNGTNYDGLEYTLYELQDPRPFAHLVYDVERVADDDTARTFMNLDWADLRNRAVITGDLPFVLPGERPGNAQVNAFNMTLPEYLEMSVTTSEPALLTLPVASYPGWRAEVNGERVDIVDVYAGLMGVPIPPGDNLHVTLAFRPMSVIGGALISVLALLVIVAYCLAVTIHNRRTLRAV